MPESAAPDRTRWGIVAVAVGAGVVVGLQAGKVPPSLPLIRDALDLSLVTGGWVASLFNLTAAALGLAAGMAADRIGPVRVITGALAAMALGGAIGAAADSAAMILFGRFLESLGFVGAGVGAPSIVLATCRPRDRSLALGIWSVYLPAGACTSMLAAPFIIEAVGWRGFWAANAAVSALSVAVVFLMLSERRWPDAPRPRRGRTWATMRAPLALPGPWLFGFCFGVYALQFYAVMTWLPTFLIEAHGADLATAAAWSAAGVVCNGIGNLSAAWLMHRGMPRWHLLALAYVIMMSCAWLVFAEAAPDALRLPAVLAFMLGGGHLPAACFAGAGAHARNPGEVATCAGIVMQLTNLGSLAGAPVLAGGGPAVGGVMVALDRTCSGMRSACWRSR